MIKCESYPNHHLCRHFNTCELKIPITPAYNELIQEINFELKHLNELNQRKRNYFKVLSDIADLTVGFVGTTAKYYVDKGIRFLRSMNVEPFKINFNDEKFISKEFNEQIKKSELHEGDVVIVRTGKPGACAVVPQHPGTWNCSDLVIIHPDQDKVDSTYLAAFINLASGVIHANLVGAVQQHFNVGSAKK